MKYFDSGLIALICAICFVFTIGYWDITNGYTRKMYTSIKILKMNVDSRDLVSIQYIDNQGDTVAQDYLTYSELQKLLR